MDGKGTAGPSASLGMTKCRVVTFLRSRQMGWTEKEQQVPRLPALPGWAEVWLPALRAWVRFYFRVRTQTRQGWGISLVLPEMWDSTAAEPPVLGPINKTIKVFGFPHLAKNVRDTRISCGFHRGKPHKACLCHQTSQEIRGYTHPSLV
jgi:hypothetical protein